ncbi:copper homeostasis membrane protein CopD [Phenylobacterium sp. 58.2.17]|uniref:copper homeostasis membrane protein CopD n=1 Tax=Phenylobacterium sp. 58.2.17 TaxID=2969306 RepID=UPI002264690D|nr:copper homeostasis membrane protein CopD [Phenylobacterium sp. 58.2.17]MCX7587790.1 copper homeostasis membrane protein CopD [Phenylobacterium sp. 58.2.17]
MDLLVATVRFVQFAAAVALFGAPLFFLYALGEAARSGDAMLTWGRGLLRWSSAALLLGALASLLGQTAVMAGDPAMATNPEALRMVLTGTAFGYATAARLVLAVLALTASLWLAPRLPLWLISVGAGALILASFTWTGHGAVEEGAAGIAHAISDIIHLLAAGVWLGALVALAVLLWRARRGASAEALAALHRALENFSGVGSLVVAALLASGLVNSWFLVGLRPVDQILATPYGVLLLIKIVLFGLMLLLAAANRFRHTPGLGFALADGEDSAPATATLRRSVLVETLLAIGVLVLVSILGMIAPVSAQM